MIHQTRNETRKPALQSHAANICDKKPNTRRRWTEPCRGPRSRRASICILFRSYSAWIDKSMCRVDSDANFKRELKSWNSRSRERYNFKKKVLFILVLWSLNSICADFASEIQNKNMSTNCNGVLPHHLRRAREARCRIFQTFKFLSHVVLELLKICVHHFIKRG